MNIQRNIALFEANLANVKRPGMDKLLEYIRKSDFYRAPASTKYHLACEGGLLQHSLNVLSALRWSLRPDDDLDASTWHYSVAASDVETIPDETAIVVALLHDICKANFYGVSYRNVKNEATGKWEKAPYYTVEDKMPLGHGAKSAMILKEYIPLTTPEMYAVWWHMGYAGLNHVDAMPGPWRNYITPYLVGVMDEFCNYYTEEIVFVKPTQVGGTECLFNILGWIISQDPSDTMFVYPSDALAERTSRNRIDPMCRLSAPLRERYKPHQSQKLEMRFQGMSLYLTGANSPSDLSSSPIKRLFLDEVDKFPGASKKEADPIKLARERTKTFRNRKICMASTPTLKTGHIWRAKEDADIEKHYFPGLNLVQNNMRVYV